MLISRDIKKAIISHLDKKEITVITGARQVGKTTLLREIADELIANGNRALFLNLDNEKDNRFFESQDLLLKKITLELGTEGYVFIDEIQRKKNAGVFLKGLYDQNLPYKLIVTGSGSLELKEKIHESLAGRKRTFEMMPVSFREFVNYRTNYKYKENQIMTFLEIEPEQRRILLNEYLNYGAYPRIVTESIAEEKIKLMDEIFRSYVEKDLVYLLKIERPEVFKSLIQILSNQIGQMVNHTAIAAQVNLSLVTLKKYLWYAEKTFSIHKVTPYYSNLAKEIIKSPVYYFTDLGLRNHAMGLLGNLQINQQFGFVFENMVFHLLKEHTAWKGWSIHYWRTKDKAEVDFVIDKKTQAIPVEVKYGNIIKPTISKSFRSFLEKYNPQEAWFITTGYENSIKLNTTEVLFKPFYKIYDT
ncbi:MAG: ATP-binding protein [Bacteroidota bacterium]